MGFGALVEAKDRWVSMCEVWIWGIPRSPHRGEPHSPLAWTGISAVLLAPLGQLGKLLRGLSRRHHLYATSDLAVASGSPGSVCGVNDPVDEVLQCVDLAQAMVTASLRGDENLILSLSPADRESSSWVTMTLARMCSDLILIIAADRGCDANELWQSAVLARAIHQSNP